MGGKEKTGNSRQGKNHRERGCCPLKKASPSQNINSKLVHTPPLILRSGYPAGRISPKPFTTYCTALRRFFSCVWAGEGGGRNELFCDFLRREPVTRIFTDSSFERRNREGAIPPLLCAFSAYEHSRVESHNGQKTPAGIRTSTFGLSAGDGPATACQLETLYPTV